MIFILLGCQSGHVTRGSKDIPKSITINEKDVREIRTWSKDSGESGRGVLLDEVRSANIIEWVNNAEIIEEAKLSPEMKAPNPLISINLTSNKTIQIFMFKEDLIIDSFKAEQKDLTEFLGQMAN